MRVEAKLEELGLVLPEAGGTRESATRGIGSALRALAAACKVYACEVETAAPLAASLAAGEPVEVEHVASFVDGIGAPTVFPEMFAFAQRLVDGAIVVGLDVIAEAIRLLAERARVVAEGAGAAPVAAALTGGAGGGKLVCVVSGGNIDASVLRTILGGNTP